jgi:hypothetical protein
MRHYPDAGALGPFGWPAEENPGPESARQERPASGEMIREIARVSEIYMDSPYLVT